MFSLSKQNVEERLTKGEKRSQKVVVSFCWLEKPTLETEIMNKLVPLAWTEMMVPKMKKVKVGQCQITPSITV